MDAKKIIELLMENICRNGTMLLNLTQHGRGDLDPEVVRTAKDVGAWIKADGEAIYGSRPFEVYGEEKVRYTRNNGHVYATVLNWKDSVLTLKALKAGGSTVGKISKVELIGSDEALSFVQDEKGLTITPGKGALPLNGIALHALASGTRVLRITHDKGWFNDDDPGVVARGWTRESNLGTGDFNNDLTISNTPGDEWRSSFTGKTVSVVAPKEPGAGKMEIKIDGKTKATVDLSNLGARKAQQLVFEVSGLSAGTHSISIINRGGGKVAVDALIIQ
jgi:alpha-L-fucosidase